MRPAAAALALALLVAACGGRSNAARDPARNDAVITVVTEVDDATVWVNDRHLGLVADLRAGIALAPGTHRIEIRHEDFHTRYLTLTLEARERRALDVELAPILP